jgi:hypothetical protein
MKEYIVTLHNKEDLEDFYNDMETPGGDLYIPDRAVDLQHRRAISRNTHYMLTDEEALQLKEDARVRNVQSLEYYESIEEERHGYSNSGSWERSYNALSNSDQNWGMLRHTIDNNVTNWGYEATDTTTASFNITASGKNVDVLIVDGSIPYSANAHPEFAVNADGTGGTRVQYFNWFSLKQDLGYGTNGTYDYNTIGSAVDTDHGCHVASTVAGSTLGWAREANIYSMEFAYSGNVNYGFSNYLYSTTRWDYIRQWHNTKPINSETGRRNPTISNHSYGGSVSKEGAITNGSYDGVGAFRYRGSLYDAWGDDGRDLTDAELNARGIYTDGSGNWKIPAYGTAILSDIEDAIADGIIVVTSAGNNSQKIVLSGDQDYDNVLYLRLGGNQYPTNGNVYSHRPDESVQNPTSSIVVGNLGAKSNDRKFQASACGNSVDIFAAGSGIVGAAISNSLAPYGSATQDARDSSFWLAKIGGTSMSSPQVCGVLALLAESNPGLTQSEAVEWLIANGTNNVMYDTQTDDAMDRESLQGAANRILRWINQRPETGMSFPKQNAKARPASGRTYPRPRMRVRG